MIRFCYSWQSKCAESPLIDVNFKNSKEFWNFEAVDFFRPCIVTTSNQTPIIAHETTLFKWQIYSFTKKCNVFCIFKLLQKCLATLKFLDKSLWSVQSLKNTWGALHDADPAVFVGSANSFSCRIGHLDDIWSIHWSMRGIQTGAQHHKRSIIQTLKKEYLHNSQCILQAHSSISFWTSWWHASDYNDMQWPKLYSH